MCTLFLSFSAFSQKESQIISFSKSANSLNETFRIIEKQTGYFFAYNSQNIPVKESFFIKKNSLEYTLKELLFEIENQFILNVEIENFPSNKIILSPAVDKIISGKIVDDLSGETIIGATVFSNSNVSTISDVNGYFRIIIPKSDSVLYFQNMGYLQKVFRPKTKYAKVEMQLESNMDLDIVITPDPAIKVKQNNKIGVKEIDAFKGIGGTPDLFGYIRSIPGISSGSEGQNGFIVRGGGPHQNMILIDGLPIYEGSHLGGLSSIFLPEAINNISFFKSAFPARYGGKLSGILDVNLKDGNAFNFNRSLSIGLEGLTAHIDGPIGENTTISLNGKFSLFSKLVEPIAKFSSDITDLKLNYNDTYIKLTQKLSKDHNISLTGYLGEDLVLIQRTGIEPYQFQDYNRISWGNKVLGVSYRGILSDKLTVSTNVGVSNYNYRSRGTYEISINEGTSIDLKSFDILSVSNLTDLVVSPRIDYYSDHLGKFTFGINYTDHKNEPTIIESERFAPNNENFKVDTTYRTDELAIYIENNMWLSSSFYLNSGLRLNSYFNNDTEYHYLQPRLSLNFKSRNDHLQLSYSSMSQFTHLLSNPGLGIPSDLWVPSTGLVPPELSHNFSFDYKYFKEKFNFGVSLFYKSFSNLIEYTDVADIFYSFILDDDLYQVAIDNKSWEERVSLGKGRAYGIETFINYKFDKYSFDFSYTFSKSERVFENLNDGKYFPYRFDRPHDLKTNLTYKISPNKSFVINWSFGTGNAYTIANILFEDPDGNPIAKPSSRNNFRVPNYHHLDINYEVRKVLKNKTILKINIGIYNVYNRLNPFYEYLSESNDGSIPDLVTIALYPVLPQVNVHWSW